MNDLGATLAVCKRTYELMDEIEDTLVPWALASSRAKRALRDALRPLGEGREKLASEWLGGTTAQLAVASVLHSPRETSRYLGSFRKQLSREAVDLLETIWSRPAFFAVFAPYRDHSGGLLEVTDHADAKKLLVYSPALGQLLREHAESYLSFLYTNGACLQAFGLMHYFRAFPAMDFHYFARLLRPQTYAATGLAGVMNDAPERFMVLDYFAEIPPITHRGRRLFRFTSSARADTFDASPLAASFDVTEACGLTRCSRRGADPVFETSEMFYDPKQRTLVIHAREVERYRELARLLERQAKFPEEPGWQVTQNMEVAATMVTGREGPAARYVRAFESEQVLGPANEELAKINALTRDITERTNHGMSWDLAELASLHGVSLENAREVQASLARLQEADVILIEGGFPGFPVPSPEEREMLHRRLESCELFRLHSDDTTRRLLGQAVAGLEDLAETLEGSQRVAEVTLETLPDILDGVDDTWWRDPHHAVLRYTFLLMCRRGAEFERTGDYAAEVLRLYWQVLIRGKDPDHVAAFREKYEHWCQELLSRAGLAVAEERGGTSWIRATPLFGAWISLSDYWRE